MIKIFCILLSWKPDHALCIEQSVPFLLLWKTNAGGIWVGIACLVADNVAHSVLTAIFLLLSYPLPAKMDGIKSCLARFILLKYVHINLYSFPIRGHFLLTNLLLDTMKKTAHNSKREGRIVNVSSRRHRLSYPEGIRFDRINDPTG